jgi:hypothetical protein
MLAKCANPVCSATFRYLHEGKLYGIESKPVSFGRKSWADPEYTGKSHTLEYFWLCSSCCCAMRVQSDGIRGITLAPQREILPTVSAMEDSTPLAA